MAARRSVAARRWWASAATRRGSSARASWAPSTRWRARSRRRSTGAEACFACAPGGRAARAGARRARGGRPRTAWSPTWAPPSAGCSAAIDDPRFVGGHPIAGRGDERRGARARRPVPGRRLVPDAAPSAPAGLLYERLHRLVSGPGAPARWRSTPRPTTGSWRCSATCRTCSPTCSCARPPGALLEEGEALRQVGPSFRDASRVAGANTAMWADVYRANREAVVEEVRRFARSLDEVADLLEADGDVAAWNDAAREDRRRLLEADLTGQPVHELRLTVPNRPGIVASGGAGTRASRGEHRGHDARAGRRHADRRDDALGRGRRRGRPRHGADRRARLSRSRAVTPQRALRALRTAPGHLHAAARTSRSRTARRCSPRCRTSRWRSATTSSRPTRRPRSARSRASAPGWRRTGTASVLVRGVGLHAPLEATGGLLDVGNSGTLMRLLPGWLAGQPGRAWTLDGDESIRRRPVDRVAEPLAAMGAGLEARDGPLSAVHRQRGRARWASSTRCRWPAPRSSPAC